MRRLISTALSFAALALAGGSSAAAADPSPAAERSSADPRLSAVESWGFAIGTGSLRGDPARRFAGYDLVVVDGQEVRPHQVRALREGGAIVLGYLSVGTIEIYRPWYRRLKPYRLEAWKDWDGEFFAAVRKRGFRRQIAGRIAPGLLAKGLDGLFLDNVDMIEGHRRQTRGMRKLVGRLGRLVDAGEGLLFAQNGFNVIGPSLRHLDGWNREDVSTSYDFDRNRYRVRGRRGIGRVQAELGEIAAAGLLVTATDYTSRAAGEIAERAIANACAAGALPYVSNIELRRVPRPPLRCG